MSAAIADQVGANARAYGRIVAVVRRRIAGGRLDSAAAWARIAAAFAMTNPHGALRDPELERLLDRISAAGLPAGHRRRDWLRQRVLHVLSEGHMVGGDVRMALRWAASDEARVPSVAITRPGSASPEFAELARARGGAALCFDSPSLLARARQLRAAALETDLAVCHTHADDPVPALAFGGAYEGPPVVLVNHADHVFGLGAGNLSVLLSQRQIAADAAVRARGYPATANLVSPLPMPGVGRREQRAAAKRRLGIDPDAVLALTLARPVKYGAAPWHPGFAEVVGPALRDLPGTVLAAVGPDPADPSWAALARELPGPLLMPGVKRDPSLYLDAADLYLDSFPFGSITSMLEAASRDVPVLVSRMYAGMEALMSSSGPLDDVVVGAADAPAYRAELAKLASDAGRRREVGATCGEAVRQRHGEQAWVEARERIHAAAEAAEPLRERGEPDADPAELAAYAGALLGIEARAPLLWTIRFCSDGFDAADRRSARARVLAVRAVQKVGRLGQGSGPRASACLVPAGVRR